MQHTENRFPFISKQITFWTIYLQSTNERECLITRPDETENEGNQKEMRSLFTFLNDKIMWNEDFCCFVTHRSIGFSLRILYCALKLNESLLEHLDFAHSNAFFSLVCTHIFEIFIFFFSSSSDLFSFLCQALRSAYGPKSDAFFVTPLCFTPLLNLVEADATVRRHRCRLEERWNRIWFLLLFHMTFNITIGDLFNCLHF